MESLEAIHIDFQKTWLLLKRRSLTAAGVFSGVVLLAAGFTCLQKPVYEAEGKILLKKIDQTSALTGLGEQIGELNGVSIVKSDPVKTGTQVMISLPVMQKTINELNLRDKKGQPLEPELLATQVKVKPLVETDVLQLFYQSNDPKEAAAVINRVMSTYIQNNVLANRAEATGASKFITEELPASETTVSQAEAALRQFKEQNHIVALDEEAKSAVEVLKDLQIKINEAQAALADANVQSENLQKKVGMSSHSAIAMNSLNQSHGVQKVLEEFQQVESELAVRRTRFQEDHPTIVNLKLKDASLKTLLQGRLEQAIVSGQQVSNGNLQIGERGSNLSRDSMYGRLFGLSSF